jgi:glutamate N-acetyltransferase/amino-acid N-acetyltransferase
MSQEAIEIAGFYFAGLSCGIKADVAKPDLAVIYALNPKTSVAGVFTKNQACAAPVTLCRQHLKQGVGRAIIINSGVANAATGPVGMKNAQSVVKNAAKVLRVPVEQVFVCSTGKIGPHLPVDKIQKGLLLASQQLSKSSFIEAAEAIRTTDAYPKTAVIKGVLGKKPFTLAVMAKGAGMICPDMATMLCFVLTDLAISAKVMQALLRDAVADTLNSLTVDGDTSTNDTVLMLASGLAENAPIKAGSAAYRQVLAALTEALETIAIKIARDGEGATKCVTFVVSGTKNKADAKILAQSVGNSPLVKTAMYGCDPNWGRILCACGYAGVKLNPQTLTMTVGGIKLFDKGKPLVGNEPAVATYLKANDFVSVAISVGKGPGQARIFSSDLTPAYVHFNADYST